MKLGNWVCGSCTTNEICGLSSHRKPEDAMLEFCKQALHRPKNKYAYYYGGANEKYDEIFPFYVFNAGPQSYGAKFAAYIKQYGLGKVVSPGKVNNKKFHDGAGGCQCWVWNPDRKALIAWFEAVSEKKEPTPAKPKRVRRKANADVGA